MTHFWDWMKNTLLFLCSTNIVVRLLTVNMKSCLTLKNPKMCDHILVTLLKKRPHYSHTSGENAAAHPPLACCKEVTPGLAMQSSKSSFSIALSNYRRTPVTQTPRVVNWNLLCKPLSGCSCGENAVIIDKIPANDTSQFRSPLQVAECGENAVIIDSIPANDTELIRFCPIDLQKPSNSS